jgi:hypothetical protein
MPSKEETRIYYELSHEHRISIKALEELINKNTETTKGWRL